MADNTYAEALQAIEGLSAADQRRLLSELTSRLRARSEEQPCVHSVMELRGLGKEVWSGVDPDQYVEQERSSWNG
jgi:hypothetical protein